MYEEYAEYLPHINVAEGTARVMNNLKLYMTLLGKFKGRQMADDLLNAIKTSDDTKVVQCAHALRGTAGNLGFPTLHEITEKIEKLGKAGEDASHLCKPLSESVDALLEVIAKITTLP